jgi:hypothetical protein
MVRALVLGLWLGSVGLAAIAQPSAGLRAITIRSGLLSLVDPYNPGAEVSIERQLDIRSSVQFTAAYLHDFFGRTPYHDFNGARVSIAKKWAFHMAKHHRWYYGLEAGASVISYNTRGRFAIPNAEGRVSLFYREYYESFAVQKQTVFSGGRIGVQGAIRRIAYDLSIGLGIKYKRTQHIGRRYPGGVLFPGFIKLDPYQIADREKNGLVGNAPMAVSIGYTF